MLQLSPGGEVLRTYDNYQGQPFKGPNDLAVDDKGGIYFTDSGDFGDDWVTGRAAGAICYIIPEGQLEQVDKDLHHSNGIAISPDGTTLYVDEHRKNRILSYTINDGGSLSGKTVFFEPDDTYLGEDPEYSDELGTDGMWCDSQGTLWVAHYGGGKVLVIGPGGNLIKMITLPEGIYPTNTTLGPDEKTLYVTEAGVGLLYGIDVK